jgi:predicted metal-dependent peptidase
MCGSAAHGVPQDYEEPPPDKGGSGLSEGEQKLIRDQVAREVIRASQTRGTIPAGLLRWAHERIAPPQVNWERELAALVRNAVTMASGCVDYSYTRPNRRGNFNGIIMPALRRPNPEAVVVLDTSGSMSDHHIGTALAEIGGVLRAVGQRNVPVICCDSAVAQAQRVGKAESVKIIGGGGTNMCVGIEAAQKLHAGVIIVLTDGETPWPDQSPAGEEMVIGLVGSEEQINAARQHCPTWCRRVLKIPVQAVDGKAA